MDRMVFTLPQPAWNQATTLADTLSQLASATTEQEAWSACGRLMYAVGNDHAGTYCPVILEVLPHLEQLLREDRPWPRFAALQTLIDWYASFSPEPGHEALVATGMSPTSLKQIVDASIAALRPDVQRIVEDGGIEKEAAIEFLDCLDA